MNEDVKSTLVKGLIGEDAFKADSITWGDKINISMQARHVLCISSMDYDYSWNGVFDHWGTMAPNWLTMRRDVRCAEGENEKQTIQCADENNINGDFGSRLCKLS